MNIKTAEIISIICHNDLSKYIGIIGLKTIPIIIRNQDQFDLSVLRSSQPEYKEDPQTIHRRKT